MVKGTLNVKTASGGYNGAYPRTSADLVEGLEQNVDERIAAADAAAVKAAVFDADGDVTPGVDPDITGSVGNLVPREDDNNTFVGTLGTETKPWPGVFAKILMLGGSNVAERLVMIEEAMTAAGIDLSGGSSVGERLRKIEAALDAIKAAFGLDDDALDRLSSYITLQCRVSLLEKVTDDLIISALAQGEYPDSNMFIYGTFGGDIAILGGEGTASARLLEIDNGDNIMPADHYEQMARGTEDIDRTIVAVPSAAEGDDSLDVATMEGLMPGRVYTITDGVREEHVTIKNCIKNGRVFRVILTRGLLETYSLNEATLNRTTANVEHGEARGTAPRLATLWNPDYTWQGFKAGASSSINMELTLDKSFEYEVEGDIIYTSDGHVTLAEI